MRMIKGVGVWPFIFHFRCFFKHNRASELFFFFEAHPSLILDWEPGSLSSSFPAAVEILSTGAVLGGSRTPW